MSPPPRRNRAAQRWRPSALDHRGAGRLGLSRPRGDSGPVLAAPQNLRLASGGAPSPGETLGIEWDAVVGATQYKVFWRHDFNDSYLTALTGSTTPAYTITGLSAGLGYQVRVSAVSGATVGLQSDPQEFNTWTPS